MKPKQNGLTAISISISVDEEIGRLLATEVERQIQERGILVPERSGDLKDCLWTLPDGSAVGIRRAAPGHWRVHWRNDVSP